jgi:hypothetical protein
VVDKTASIRRLRQEKDCHSERIRRGCAKNLNVET